METARLVAAKLGNTPAICRKCYIHPQVFSAFSAGKLAALKSAAGPKLIRELLKPPRGKRRGAKRDRQCNPTPRIKFYTPRKLPPPTAARALSG